MEKSLYDDDFLNCFDLIGTFDIDEYQKYKLNLFVPKIKSNEFDYDYLSTNLLDPLISFSLSRKTYSEYAHKPGILNKKAKEKFLDYMRNKGELGELLLFAFLESHLNAPKILSKLELKTSTSHYVNGSDGVHYLKLENGDYQLIFGESKMEINLVDGLRNAFKSIHDFKNEKSATGGKKSGLPYERSLISDHLDKETFSQDEKAFIKSIIYPQRESEFEVDDSFGVFVGYQTNIDDQDKFLPNDKFREKVHRQINDQISDRIAYLRTKITEFDLMGHNFYFYLLPFTNLDRDRQKILREATS